jgi:hypothetical protein
MPNSAKCPVIFDATVLESSTPLLKKFGLGLQILKTGKIFTTRVSYWG